MLNVGRYRVDFGCAATGSLTRWYQFAVRYLTQLGPIGVALAFITLPSVAAEIGGTERAIIGSVKARIPAAISFLEHVVNINSGTMNHEGVQQVGKLFRTEFDDLGFKTRWISLPPETNRAGHLEAIRRGSQGKRLLLIGHLDTVFEKDSPLQRWNRTGNKVKGPGVMDMKGGIIVILEALRALNSVGALKDTSITVMLTGDEERPGEPLTVSRGDLIAAAKISDIALSFEALLTTKEGVDTATTARRGLTFWTLTASGKQGHAALIFGNAVGYGAIYEAARILNTFRERLIESDLTFNAGIVLGGTDVEYDVGTSKGIASGKNNVVPRALRIEGDLRFLSDEQRDRTKIRMREIVSKNLPGTGAEIAFQDTYPALTSTLGNQKLLQELSRLSVEAGYNPVEAIDPRARGAADISFVAPYVDCLDGLGAGGTGAHSLEEELDVQSIERATVRAALLIYRLTRTAEK